MKLIICSYTQFHRRSFVSHQMVTIWSHSTHKISQVMDIWHQQKTRIETVRPAWALLRRPYKPGVKAWWRFLTGFPVCFCKNHIVVFSQRLKTVCFQFWRYQNNFSWWFIHCGMIKSEFFLWRDYEWISTSICLSSFGPCCTTRHLLNCDKDGTTLLGKKIAKRETP